MLLDTLQCGIEEYFTSHSTNLFYKLCPPASTNSIIGLLCLKILGFRKINILNNKYIIKIH